MHPARTAIQSAKANVDEIRLRFSNTPARSEVQRLIDDGCSRRGRVAAGALLLVAVRRLVSVAGRLLCLLLVGLGLGGAVVSVALEIRQRLVLLAHLPPALQGACRGPAGRQGAGRGLRPFLQFGDDRPVVAGGKPVGHPPPARAPRASNTTTATASTATLYCSSATITTPPPGPGRRSPPRSADAAFRGARPGRKGPRRPEPDPEPAAAWGRPTAAGGRRLRPGRRRAPALHRQPVMSA